MKRYFKTVQNQTANSETNEICKPGKSSSLNTENLVGYSNDLINDHVESSDSSDLKLPKRKQYIQKYKAEWEIPFPWLRKVNDQAFCSVCFKILANNKTNLQRHETRSTTHAQNIKVKHTTQTIEKSFQSHDNNSVSYQKKVSEFSCVLYCVQYDLPFLQMDSLPKLLQTTCRDSQIAKSIKCGRTKATAIINQIIGPFAKQFISGQLRNAKFSLMIDETTDVSTAKCLVIVVRLFDINRNKIVDYFLGLIELNASTAQEIFNAIQQNFFDSNIPMENIISLAVDNAAVMTGHLNGVVSKLNQICKNLFLLRCTCHTLHLCASAACKKLPNSIEKNIKNIFNHFAQSPKRIGAFRDFQTYFNIKSHKILRLSATRWLSFESVVNRLLEQFDALKYYFSLHNFEELNSSNAGEINEFLMNPLTKLYLLFVSYILKLVNDINKNFQSEFTQIHVLYIQMRGLYNEILKNFIKPEYLNCEINILDSNMYLPESSMHFGLKFEEFLISAKIEEEATKSLKTSLVLFYIELCNQIKSRFDFNSENLKLLKYLNINEIAAGSLPSILPLLKCFPFYDGDVEILNNQFRFLIGNFEIAAQFSSDVTSFWIKLKLSKDALGETNFLEMSSYMLLLCALPHSTASAERKFSKLNLIKTNTRNSLNITTVENVMLANELLNLEKDCWEPSDTPGLLKFSEQFKFTDGKYTK